MTHPTKHTPEQRHPQTVAKMKWGFVLAGLVFGGIMGYGIVLVKHALAPTYVQHLTHVRAIQAGETAKSDLYEATVSNVHTVGADPAFTPAPGDDIVVVTLKLKNTTRALQHFFPSIMTYIRDDEGTTYIMHPTLALTNPLPGGDIVSGQTQSGELSYEIPQSLKHFRLYIDPAWDNMVPIVATLNR